MSQRPRGTSGGCMSLHANVMLSADVCCFSVDYVSLKITPKFGLQYYIYERNNFEEYKKAV